MSDLIMGKNTVLEILKHRPEIILEILTAKNKNDPLIINIKNKNIKINFVDKKHLTAIVKSDSHQNIIAKIKQRKYVQLNDFLSFIDKKSDALVIMLDSIFDPQNLGSILRSAECFSVDGVVFSKNRGSDISSVVTKAASGATELVNLIKVSNLANTLDLFLNKGFSSVASVLDNNSKDLYQFRFPKKSLLILGSEGRGIQDLLLKKSDYKIHIPITGRLQSFNVSNAASIILAYIRFGAR